MTSLIDNEKQAAPSGVFNLPVETFGLLASAMAVYDPKTDMGAVDHDLLSTGMLDGEGTWWSIRLDSKELGLWITRRPGYLLDKWAPTVQEKFFSFNQLRAMRLTLTPDETP